MVRLSKLVKVDGVVGLADKVLRLSKDVCSSNVLMVIFSNVTALALLMSFSNVVVLFDDVVPLPTESVSWSNALLDTSVLMVVCDSGVVRLASTVILTLAIAMVCWIVRRNLLMIVFLDSTRLCAVVISKFI